jgi:hypothetical protein
MKCDFCTWNARPETIPAVTQHLNGNHWGLENYWIVWRQGQIVLAREKEESDIELTFDRPKFIVPPEPPVVKYANPGDINVTLQGSVLVNEGTGEIKSTRGQGQGRPLSPGDDVTPLIGQ